MPGRKKKGRPLGGHFVGRPSAVEQAQDLARRIEQAFGAQAVPPGEAYDAETEKAIEGIYANIKSGRVLLYPALAGTRYNTGEYIFMYDDLYDLLLRYGYDSDLVEKFIERFWRRPLADGQPIVMMSRNKTEICDDEVVKPIR